VGAEVLQRRHLLRDLMEAAGFNNYEQEWWHYTLNDEPFPDQYFDFPVR
jgi:D-alanyl-D-alanine dipeptidase